MKHLTIAAGFAAALVASALPVAASHANLLPIRGSDAILVGGITPIGGSGDLLTAAGFTLTNDVWAHGSATGSFMLIPLVTPPVYGPVVTSGSLTTASLGTHTFSSSEGSFTAAPSVVMNGVTFTTQVVSQSGSEAAGFESLVLFIVGSFAPAGDLAAFATTNASETLAFTETGIRGGADPSLGSFSVSATFAALEAPIPEPASLLMLGAGLLGLSALRRQRCQVASV